ncbi:MAG: nuclear transport factor 2 family protein [Methanothrix sp.]|jgi:ketosteroid isomerase-like protein|nr:nuclear transport factor 2 family protein [Methanothrix harundinacea]MDD2638635.1 nuclear transport factor 2 family protein [Methanothrix sp.]MDD3709398.1 nuclear transport factor 2 family protein [Methanothrix sp.]MDD5768893.1 nuclear transport factor 2 family protein [Methanothrix sp.]MDI9398797.1 nuclear transport factor 2 family protein [Euryarchaeota archaeon]
MTTISDFKAAATEAMERYAQAYSAKDLEGIMATADEEFFGYGSGPDEEVYGKDLLRAQVERDLSQSDRISMILGPGHVSGKGDVAWYAGSCTIEATVEGQDVRMEGRITAVLKKVGERWLIAMSHFAMPFGGQETGQSWPEAK